MRENCIACNIGGVGRRSPHFKQKYGKCNICQGLGWTDSYDVDYLVDKQETNNLSTKEELQKMVAMFKEQTLRLQKINKQRFDRIAELGADKDTGTTARTIIRGASIRFTTQGIFSASHDAG